jgi:hypothetical protein
MAPWKQSNLNNTLAHVTKVLDLLVTIKNHTYEHVQKLRIKVEEEKKMMVDSEHLNNQGLRLTIVRMCPKHLNMENWHVVTDEPVEFEK